MFERLSRCFSSTWFGKRSLPTLVGTAAVFVALLPGDAYPQDCELEYSYSTGTFTTSSGSVDLNSGESQSVSVSGLTEALNAGRNDILVALEGAGITDPVRVVKFGSGTMLVPPTVFSPGTELEQVECLGYATVEDANDYLQEFGASASSLYEDAYDDAWSAVDQLRDEALSTFDLQEAQMLVDDAGSAVAELEATWEALLEEAGGTEPPSPGDIVSTAAEVQRTAIVGPAEAVLEEHFPEVHEAVQATESFAFDVVPVLEQAEQNAATVLDRLASLDQKYGASAAAADALTVDVARSFPELDALARWECPAVDARLEGYAGDLQTLGQLLGDYLGTYLTPAEAVDILERSAPSRASLAPIRDALEAASAGCPEAAELDGTVAEDLDRLRSHFEEVDQEVTSASGAIRARPLAAELGTLGERTATVLANLSELERRHSEVVDAKEEMEETAQEVASGNVGHPGTTEDLSFIGSDLLEAASTLNAEAEKERMEELRRKMEAYQQALDARSAAWQELMASIDRWAEQSETVADAAGRVRLRRAPPALDRLIGRLGRPPRLATASRAITGASTCASRLVAAWTRALRAYEAAVQPFFDEVAALADRTISPELKEAMEEASDAASREAAANRAALVTAGELFVEAHLATSPPTDALIDAIESMDDGSGPVIGPEDFIPDIDQDLASLRNAYDDLEQRARELERTASEVRDAQVEVYQSRVALAEAIVGEGAGVSRELMELGRTIQRQLEREDRFYADVEAAVGCAEEGGPLFSAAIADTPDRLDDFLASRAEALAGVVPAEIRNQVQSTLEAAETLEAELQLLADVLVADEVNSMAAALLEAEQARAEAVEALVPAPQPDAVEKTQAAVDAWEEVGSRAQNVQNALDDVATAETELMSELDALESSLLAQGGELAGDAGELVFTGLESDQLIAAKVAEAEELPALWADAGATLDSRLAAFGGTAVQAMVDELEPIMGPGLNQLAAEVATLSECFEEAEIHRQMLAGSQLIDEVASQTVSGLQAEGDDVISDLQSLTPPSPTTLANLSDELDGIFQNAASLSESLASVASDAQIQFNQMAGSQMNGLQQAAGCIDDGHGTIDQQVADLSADIESAAQSAGVNLEEL